jgi:hypothetical protein
MTSWLPKDLKDAFDGDNWQAEADQVIKGVTDRVKQAVEPVQQAAETATSGASKLVTGLAGMWGEPEQPPGVPTTPAPTTPAANVAPAAMPSARRFVPSTGQEVGNVDISQGGTRASRYGREIAQIAAEEGVPADALAALVDTEDSDEKSTSPAGAKGLLQVVPGQGYDLPGEDAFDPATSIRQGARALKDKARIAGGDWDEAGAAYFGYGTDAGGMTTSAYRDRYIANRRKYQGSGAIQEVPLASQQPAGEEQVTYRDQWGNTYTTPRSKFDARPGGNADVTVVSTQPAQAPRPAPQPAAPITGDLTPSRRRSTTPTSGRCAGRWRPWRWPGPRARTGPWPRRRRWPRAERLLGRLARDARAEAEAQLLNRWACRPTPGRPTGRPSRRTSTAATRSRSRPGGFPAGTTSSWRSTTRRRAKYYVGGAGNTLKVTTGRSKWMTVEEMQALGPVNGALYMDNPNTPTPSVARQEAPQPAQQTAAVPSAQAEDLDTPSSRPQQTGPQPLEQIRQLGQRGSGAPQAEMRRQPLKLTDSLAAMWSDEPTDDSTGFDEGAHEANASSPPTTYGASGDDAGQQPSVPARQEPEPPQDQQQGGGILNEIGSRVRRTLQPVADAISDPVGTARALILPDPERPGRFIRAATDGLGIHYRDRPDPTEPDATSVIDPAWAPPRRSATRSGAGRSGRASGC